jgi:hypothetical protein
VRDVGEQPGERGEHGDRQHDPGVAPNLPLLPEEPRERGDRDGDDLRGLPPAETQDETQERCVDPASPLGKTEDEQENETDEDEAGPVEAVRSIGLPHEVGRPDPEEHRGDPCRRLAHGPSSDPPDEDGRDGGANERDGSDDLCARAEESHERHGCEHLLRAPVALSPEERRELSLLEVPRHQSPDRFVSVERAERGDVGEEPKADAGEHAEDDNRCKAPCVGSGRSRIHRLNDYRFLGRRHGQDVLPRSERAPDPATSPTPTARRAAR